MKTKFIFITTCYLLLVTTSFTQNNVSSFPKKVTYPRAWLLRGNSGTDTAINFIGTKDAQPLLFKVNNEKAGYLDYNGLTGFGYLTLNANVVSDTGGFVNNAFGGSALSANTTGFENAAFGSGSLYSNTVGAGNTAVGNFTLYYNITGGINTAIGDWALVSNTTGGGNTASGAYALASNTTGYNNVANGTPYTLAFNTEGYENTAIGAVSMSNNTTGNANAAYGSYSLASNITGSNNTGLGYAADVTADGLTNATAIGNGALVDASNKVRVGNIDVTSIGGQVGWTNYSDERIKDDVKENVPGLEFIKALRPVTYHFSVAKENALLGIKNNLSKNISTLQLKELKTPDGKVVKVPEIKNFVSQIKEIQYKDKNEIEKVQFTGFLAQDVDKAAKSIGYDFSGIDKTGKIMGLRYSEFVVPLVKAVQELSKMNDEKDERINDLQKQIDALKVMISSNNSNGKINATLSDVSLEQNIPNPFSKSTAITYTLPRKLTNAQIVIIDKDGKVLKQINISGSGKGTINLDGSTLAAGTYNFSLLIDGRIISSKQMVLMK